MRRPAEERAALESGLGEAFFKAAGEVRVRDKGVAEGHEVSVSLVQHPFRTCGVVLSRHDDRDPEPFADGPPELFREMGGIVPVRLDEMQVGNALGLQVVGRLQDGRKDIRVDAMPRADASVRVLEVVRRNWSTR